MVGDNIRKYRTQKEMTQAELAKKLGTSAAVISSWEVNRTEPNVGQCIAMSNIFGISLDELCTGKEADENKAAEGAAMRRLIKYISLTADQRVMVDNYIDFVCDKQM